jgi:glycine oxidase
MDARTADVIIIGHGLAGATLAWHLHWRGWRVLVVDRDELHTSSKVAAGIVTPISGKRVARSWRVDDFLPAARDFYARTEKELGETFYRSVPYVRMLQSSDERRRWQEKRHDPAFQALLTHPQPQPMLDASLFHTQEEGLEMKSAWLDVRAWLAASRRYLEQRGDWLTAEIQPEDIFVDDDGVTAAGCRAPYLVFCQGWEAARNPRFSWLKWKSAKGEILQFRAPALTGHRIVNLGGWMLPLGRDGLFRAGSTYVWDDFTSLPTSAARDIIEARLHRALRVPFTITGHEAAVRPIINESKAVIGLHPVQRRLAFFNGLGSKGVLHAPFFAAQLAALLIDGTAVDYEVDLCRN